jgi:hypothetical protein
MKESLYKGYWIIATAQNQDGAWRSLARITRVRVRRTTEVQDKPLFTSEIDAEEHALRIAQHWVNNYLQTKQRIPKEKERLTACSAALKFRPGREEI